MARGIMEHPSALRDFAASGIRPGWTELEADLGEMLTRS